MNRYPNSRYVKDASLRMSYLVNSLAQHEVHVARCYMKRQAYVGAVNRCIYIMEFYPDTPEVEEALVIMISAYDAMVMNDLRDDTKRVLVKNYPDSPILTGNAPSDERVWWKFWESLL